MRSVDNTAGVHPAVKFQISKQAYFKGVRKKKPAYFSGLAQFENSSALLLTRSWNILNFIRRLGCRLCLLCEGEAQDYDLGFVYEKEVWILHDERQDFGLTFELARVVQRAGASKTIIIRMDVNEAQEVEKYVRY